MEASFCYTLSPAHNNGLFVDMAKRLEDMGADTICIKDMAGLLSPYSAFELISKLKKAVRAPIHLHTHDTSGMATATYLKAIEAGVDIVDTAISSLASGTSQPPTETLVSILKGTKYDTGLDINLLTEIAAYFRNVRKNYKKYESEFTGVDPDVLVYQIPGGMTSNLASQLNEQKALNRMYEVLAEVPVLERILAIPLLLRHQARL